jgi:pimeloyl-ACP methyl ester carboxylesterase
VAASPAASPSPDPSLGTVVRREGSYEGGSYRIVVPPGWNGGLVMFAHGIQFDRAAIVDPPISRQITDRGYAWAASSYRDRDYRPDLGVADTLSLQRLFVREFGQPRRTILYGQSMGGQVVMASLELYPETYQAGLAECGLVDGIWEADYLGAYTAAAEYISGVRLLDAPNTQAFGRLVNEKWLRVMGRPGAYTEKGRQFDSVVKHLMGGDLPFYLEGLNYQSRYLANLGWRANPETTTNLGQRHLDTRHVVYAVGPGLGLDAAVLNAEVRRLEPPPGARSRQVDPVFADLTGQIGVPILTLHMTGDAWVPFSHEQRYRRRAIQAGTDRWLVQRAIRRANHCGFSTEERTQAFDDLVAWMEHGTKPNGDDVLAADLSTVGVHWTKPLEVGDPARR